MYVRKVIEEWIKQSVKAYKTIRKIDFRRLRSDKIVLLQ